MKSDAFDRSSWFICRSPHGERELKLPCGHAAIAERGRSPHGERELKFAIANLIFKRIVSRSPHGERELKYRLTIINTQMLTVAPHTGSVS